MGNFCGTPGHGRMHGHPHGGPPGLQRDMFHHEPSHGNHGDHHGIGGGHHGHGRGRGHGRR